MSSSLYPYVVFFVNRWLDTNKRANMPLMVHISSQEVKIV